MTNITALESLLADRNRHVNTILIRQNNAYTNYVNLKIILMKLKKTISLIIVLQKKELSKLTFCSLLTLISFNGYNQEYVDISFDTISNSFRKQKTDQIKSISFRTDIKELKNQEDYKLIIQVDNDETTLSSKDYEIYYKPTLASKLKEKEKIFIKIKKDTLSDRTRTIKLNIRLFKGDSIAKIPNIGDFESILINIKPIRIVNGYEYLGYIGTNFDLVEGIQAKDLFFAANIFKSPEQTLKKKVGFYLSLYGNRALSQIDSSGILKRVVAVEAVSDTSYQVINETRSIRRTRFSDNLGAYISPLWKITSKKSPNSTLNLYYSPSLEFIYRRTKTSISDFGSPKLDTIPKIGDINEETARPQNLPSPRNDTFNEYSFNLGVLGIFLALENKQISVRVHGSVGYASNYFIDFEKSNSNSSILVQQSDLFFSGRAWITEPKSGVTLQAEVTNSAFNPRPFFVATLSKAFDFEKIGTIFTPLSSR
ncbi:hypothetical protein AWE51_02885 [Aquimarina aggregata]|uniref:Uncharacterized protein n=2 Tax=Aquimarina aggregata TaxID=1642818 RepID=A0A162CUK3_9FLAO|nr:hypothetical protein AWE51_02885 [Aquimarina aggregata]